MNWKTIYDFMTKYILVNKLPFDKYKKNIASDAIILIVIGAALAVFLLVFIIISRSKVKVR